MADIFNEHYRDFIEALNKSSVDYILVGGLAVVLHGYVRGTGDMDIWVNKTPENYDKLIKAFSIFGMPVSNMTKKNFLSNKYDVWGAGVKPVRIKILTAVKGLTFEDTFKEAVWFEDDGLKIRLIHLNQLLIAKKASGRYRDLDDIEQLTKK